MALTGKWKELHDSRFRDLPADCERSPMESSDPALRDWSEKWTTPDQLRIEKYIDQFDLRKKRILHIGVGNSGLARRFHGRAGEIVGTSLDEPEVQLARGLSFPNYRTVLHNKYSGRSAEISGRFDFIVENNPTSACCCLRHLAELLGLLESKLAESGQIVTDRVGLAWIPQGANPRWSFDFADLREVASAVGLIAWKINGNTYVLCRGVPSKPALRGRLGRWIRTLRDFASMVRERAQT